MLLFWNCFPSVKHCCTTLNTQIDVSLARVTVVGSSKVSRWTTCRACVGIWWKNAMERRARKIRTFCFYCQNLGRDDDWREGDSLGLGLLWTQQVLSRFHRKTLGPMERSYYRHRFSRHGTNWLCAVSILFADCGYNVIEWTSAHVSNMRVWSFLVCILFVNTVAHMTLTTWSQRRYNQCDWSAHLYTRLFHYNHYEQWTPRTAIDTPVATTTSVLTTTATTTALTRAITHQNTLSIHQIVTVKAKLQKHCFPIPLNFF